MSEKYGSDRNGYLMHTMTEYVDTEFCVNRRSNKCQSTVCRGSPSRMEHAL
ncbi:hypothetical protein DPMN_015739 [Dreissena polymorpha]|uniref:Uncharacterized protein n=1 Tax=Dreissena polymorpha TaxID=45954 RepID=A0A9D4NDD9_DREPO|nr:hypothetical protein DPMN_015073 [Dreissena polymorpha]KAH3891634.1 hypothetical protein DPMN_015739 [Dreissena polymorpha]